VRRRWRVVHREQILGQRILVGEGSTEDRAHEPQHEQRGAKEEGLGVE
jgi:hypothetical protein